MKRLMDMTEPQISAYLDMAAAATESIMPAADNPRGRALFALVIFDEPGILRLVTNAEMDDTKRAMREALSREGRI